MGKHSTISVTLCDRCAAHAAESYDLHFIMKHLSNGECGHCHSRSAVADYLLGKPKKPRKK